MQLTSLFEGKHSRPCFKNNCSLNTLSAGCHVQGTIVVIVLIICSLRIFLCLNT
jgi:hypothetical protein